MKNTPHLLILLLFLLVISFSGNVFQFSSQKTISRALDNKKDQAIAKIENKVFTLGDLENEHREVFRIRKSLYRSQKNVAQKWLFKKAIELDAKKQELTPDELIKKEAQNIQLTISEEEVNALIVKLGAIYPDPTHPTKKTIIPKEDARKYLLEIKRDQLRNTLAERILKTFSHKIFLKEPKGPTIPENLAIASRPSFGNPNAKVKIVEFSDFECPYCKQLALITLKKVRKDFEDKIYFVYRDLPISHHKYAFNAAIAAKCAAKQSKFWEYHDMLFENQNKLRRQNLIGYARKVGLKIKSFKNCMLDKTISRQVEEDLTKATQYSIRSTPTLIINGEVVEGSVSYPYLKEKILDLLDD